MWRGPQNNSRNISCTPTDMENYSITPNTSLNFPCNSQKYPLNSDYISHSATLTAILTAQKDSVTLKKHIMTKRNDFTCRLNSIAILPTWQDGGIERIQSQNWPQAPKKQFLPMGRIQSQHQPHGKIKTIKDHTNPSRLPFI